MGCPKRVETASGPAPKAVQLLTETQERETDKWPDSRADIEIDTTDHDRTPRIVAKGETGVIETKGARARLFGDADGKEGFYVDNLILLETLSLDGKVLDRAAVGFTPGLSVGKNTVDLLGRQSFTFDAGEVNLTNFLPANGAFKLRATVLDNYGVGKVSNVWLVFDREGAGGSDDLKNDQ